MSTLPRVVVTRTLPQMVEARLQDLFDVQLNSDDSPLSREALTQAMQQADGVLATVTDSFDAEVLRADGRRKAGIVASFAVGYNNFDLATAKAEGIAVTNTPGVLTEATADTALLLLLAASRKAWAFEGALRRGEWTGFAPTGFMGIGLQGKTLGIIGMGRIGQAMARRCGAGLGMHVIYYNRSPVDVEGADARPSIEAVMAEADVVSLHLPGGGENRHVISEQMIARMKPAALLINSARGDVVDEAALVAALQEGRIAGAGLDVFEHEPQVPDELKTMKNVSLLPHIGSATHETRTAMGMLAVDNLDAFFAGRPCPTRVV